MPSLFLVLVITTFYDYWFVDSQIRIREAAVVNPAYKFKMVDFVLLAGSIYDHLTLALSNSLVAWHLSLLFRLFRNNGGAIESRP